MVAELQLILELAVGGVLVELGVSWFFNRDGGGGKVNF